MKTYDITLNPTDETSYNEVLSVIASNNLYREYDIDICPSYYTTELFNIPLNKIAEVLLYFTKPKEKLLNWYCYFEYSLNTIEEFTYPSGESGTVSKAVWVLREPTAIDENYFPYKVTITENN